MKKIKAGFIAVSLLIAMGCADAQPSERSAAPSRGWAIAPFQPELIRNHVPELCVPYAEAWTGLFKGAGLMDSADLDIARIPHDAIFSFPPTVPEGAAARNMSLYGQYDSVRHDLDGDGDKEVLLIVSEDHGWRYLGSSLYVFDTEADFEAVMAQFQAGATFNPKRGTYHPVWKLAEMVNETTPGPVSRFGPLRRVHLILYQGAIYTVSDKHWNMGYRSDRTHETLRRIWPAPDPEPVCEMRVRPEPEQFEPFISASPFFAALTAMYAGPEKGGMCYGTMGWTGIPPEKLLPDMFFRPQAKPEPQGVLRREEDAASDMARQLRPLDWGASNPMNWQVYLSLKKDEPEFLRRMTEYYADRFGLGPEAAKATTMQAYRALVDRVFYARNSDRSLAWLGGADFTFPATIDQIMDEVTARVGQAEPTEWSRLDIRARATSAAILSGRPANEIGGLFLDTMETVNTLDQTESLFGRKTQKARMYDMILPAAEMRPDVLEMLIGLGAPVDEPTNGFGKTPLMYAAQMNQMESARHLLKAGVDINARTGPLSDAAFRNTCTRLERDNRSALMYAAENASEALITALLDAGADPGAQDTQGNGVAWYLDRNVILDGEARARIASRLDAKAPMQAD